MTKEATVYLICDPDREMYKIGVTRGSVEKRIKKLQTGNATSLFVMYEYKTKNAFLIEKMLHNKFYPKNELNEWFKLDLEDISKFNETCEEMESRLMALKDNPFIKKKIKSY